MAGGVAGLCRAPRKRGHQYPVFPTFLSASGTPLNQLQPDLQPLDAFFSLSFFFTFPCTLRPFLPQSLLEAPSLHTRLPGLTSGRLWERPLVLRPESFTHCSWPVASAAPPLTGATLDPDGLPFDTRPLVVARGRGGDAKEHPERFRK